MPFTSVTNADLTTVYGPLAIKDDPTNASSGTGSFSLGSMSINSAGSFSGSGIQANMISGGVSASVATIASSGTITTSGVRIAQTTVAGAVTSCVMATGVLQGQSIQVVNENTTGSNSITFAASGTSNVANGATTVISGLTHKSFTWIGSLWYSA